MSRAALALAASPCGGKQRVILLSSSRFRALGRSFGNICLGRDHPRHGLRQIRCSISSRTRATAADLGVDRRRLPGLSRGGRRRPGVPGRSAATVSRLPGDTDWNQNRGRHVLGSAGDAVVIAGIIDESPEVHGQWCELIVTKLGPPDCGPRVKYAGNTRSRHHRLSAA